MGPRDEDLHHRSACRVESHGGADHAGDPEQAFGVASLDGESPLDGNTVLHTDRLQFGAFDRAQRLIRTAVPQRRGEAES